MSWFILSLLSVGFLATAELTQQHLLNKHDAFTPRTSAILTFLLQTIFIVPFVILFARNDVLDIFGDTIFYYVIFVALLSSAGMVFYLSSFRVKNISYSTIFVSFSAIVSTVLGIILFDESTSPAKFLGIFLVLSAIVGASYRNIQLERNHLFGLVAGAIFGVAFVVDKHVVTTVSPFVYILWNYPLLALFGFLIKPVEVLKSIQKKPISAYRAIILSAAGYLLYNLFTLLAYTHGGEVGRVDAINNSQIFLIILFEYFIMKHRRQLGRKLTMAAIAYTGVSLLGLVA